MPARRRPGWCSSSSAGRTRPRRPWFRTDQRRWPPASVSCQAGSERDRGPDAGISCASRTTCRARTSARAVTPARASPIRTSVDRPAISRLPVGQVGRMSLQRLTWTASDRRCPEDVWISQTPGQDVFPRLTSTVRKPDSSRFQPAVTSDARTFRDRQCCRRGSPAEPIEAGPTTVSPWPGPVRPIEIRLSASSRTNR